MPSPFPPLPPLSTSIAISAPHPVDITHWQYSCLSMIVVHKHVTLREAKVGTVALLQYHNSISHVAVHKVNLEVGPVGAPPLVPYHWVLEVCELLWEGNLIGLSLPQGWGGGRFSPNTPGRCRSFPEDLLAYTPPPDPPRTTGTPPSSAVSIGRMEQRPPLAACNPTLTICQGCNRAGRPCLPSYVRSYEDMPS